METLRREREKAEGRENCQKNMTLFPLKSPYSKALHLIECVPQSLLLCRMPENRIRTEAELTELIRCFCSKMKVTVKDADIYVYNHPKIGAASRSALL